MLSGMPSKSSPLDVLPYVLATKVMRVRIPTSQSHLANLSLQSRKFRARHKTAQVFPLPKKAGLDSSLPEKYRPISNLSTVSKVLERLVLARLRPHLLGYQLQRAGLHTRRGIPPRLHYWKSWGPGRSLHGGRQQASHCVDQP